MTEKLKNQPVPFRLELVVRLAAIVRNHGLVIQSWPAAEAVAFPGNGRLVPVVLDGGFVQ
jgi:hypothetical protein